MTDCLLLDSSKECPIPSTEDRLMECFHHANRFEQDYHDPRAFRFNLNSILASISSVSEILQKEIEKDGRIETWNIVRAPFKQDPWLGAIRRARNTTLHQKSIFDGSQLDVGLYRWRRHKLSLRTDVRGDTHSAVVLQRWTQSEAGALFLDPAHSAIGEEYGVWRKYWIDEISKEEDVLLTIRRALVRTHDLVAAGHGIYDIQVPGFPDEFYLSARGLAEVSVLLESDVDPSLWNKWGWK